MIWILIRLLRQESQEKDFPGALVAIGVHEVVRINDNLMEGNGSPEEHSIPQHSSPVGKGTFIFINAHFCKKKKAHFCKISPQGVLYCATKKRENILNDEGYPSLLPVTTYFLIGWKISVISFWAITRKTFHFTAYY